MEDVIKVVFWIIFGLIWFISALAKKKRVLAVPSGKKFERKPGAGQEEYEASEDEIGRFFRMISGEEKEELSETVKPEKVEPVHVEPAPAVFREQAEKPKEIETAYEKLEQTASRFQEEERKGLEKTLEVGEENLLPNVRNLSLNDVQRGIVLSEILGKPRTEQPFLFPDR